VPPTASTLDHGHPVGGGEGVWTQGDARVVHTDRANPPAPTMAPRKTSVAGPPQTTTPGSGDAARTHLQASTTRPTDSSACAHDLGTQRRRRHGRRRAYVFAYPIVDGDRVDRCAFLAIRLPTQPDGLVLHPAHDARLYGANGSNEASAATCTLTTRWFLAGHRFHALEDRPRAHRPWWMPEGTARSPS